MSIIKTEDEMLQKLSVDLEVSVEELKADLDKKIVEVKADPKFSGLTDEQVRNFARNRLVTSKRRELLSPAITWEGIVLGIGDLTDALKSLKTATEDAFKADSEKTRKGWTFAGKAVLADKNGKPLYPKTDANEKFRRVGKPLPEHSWLRNVVGLAAPIDKKTHKVGDAKMFSLTLNGDKAMNAKAILSMMPTRFKAVDKTTEEDIKAGVYRLSSSAFTVFENAPDMQLPATEKLLENSGNYVILGELEMYFQKNVQPDGRLGFDKWVITQGSVSSIDLTPNEKTGNLRMVLDDESMIFAPPKESGFSGVTAWIPTDRGLDTDFAQDSRVYVVGKLNRGKAVDPVTKQPIEGALGDIMINVWGLYVPEIFKVKAEVKALTAESLTATPEEIPPEEDAPEGEEW